MMTLNLLEWYWNMVDPAIKKDRPYLNEFITEQHFYVREIEQGKYVVHAGGNKYYDLNSPDAYCWEVSRSNMQYEWTITDNLEKIEKKFGKIVGSVQSEVEQKSLLEIWWSRHDKPLYPIVRMTERGMEVHELEDRTFAPYRGGSYRSIGLDYDSMKPTFTYSRLRVEKSWGKIIYE